RFTTPTLSPEATWNATAGPLVTSTLVTVSAVPRRWYSLPGETAAGSSSNSSGLSGAAENHWHPAIAASTAETPPHPRHVIQERNPSLLRLALHDGAAWILARDLHL